MIAFILERNGELAYIGNKVDKIEHSKKESSVLSNDSKT